MCSDTRKDTLHALFTCPLTIQFWQAVNLWDDVEQAVI